MISAIVTAGRAINATDTQTGTGMTNGGGRRKGMTIMRMTSITAPAVNVVVNAVINIRGNVGFPND